MLGKTLRAVAATLAISLLAPGCLVPKEQFLEKIHEVDTLRDALANASREKNALTARNESLQRQIADVKEGSETVSAKLKAAEQELSRLNTELGAAKRSYEGTRITREELIEKLMDKEKTTGKRIQDLAARVQTSDAECERLRKEIERNKREIAALETALGDLKAKLDNMPQVDALRLERDTLLGRVERLTEERKQDDRKREARFEAIAAALGAPAVPLAASGRAARIPIPDKGLFRPGTLEATETGKVFLDAVAAVFAEFPSAAAVLHGPDAKALRSLSTALSDGAKVPPERLAEWPGEKDAGAELILFIP